MDKKFQRSNSSDFGQILNKASNPPLANVTLKLDKLFKLLLIMRENGLNIKPKKKKCSNKESNMKILNWSPLLSKHKMCPSNFQTSHLVSIPFLILPLWSKVTIPFIILNINSEAYHLMIFSQPLFKTLMTRKYNLSVKLE